MFGDDRGNDETSSISEAGRDRAIGRLSGEFVSPVLETVFTWERLPETLRHARLLMIGSAILNTLFLASDWRFHGTPHFFVAVPARLVTIILAIACLFVLGRIRTPRAAAMTMAAWMAINGVAVGALVTSHSSIALFVVVMLPMIYYLVTPTRFDVVVGGGVLCSVAMFIGYGEYAASPTTAGGLALALVMLNCALVLVVSRANRLERLQWLAARSERRIAAELAESRETLERMFAASPIPLVVTDRDSGRVVKANTACAGLLGRDPLTDGGTLEPFYVAPGDRDQLVAMIDRDGQIGDVEMEIRVTDGTLRTVLIKANAVSMPQGRRIMAGMIDITDRKAVERSLEWLASTDALTGLPNRHSFMSSGKLAIAIAARSSAPLSLLMLDLDHFKQINDTWGHQMGDRALQAFAELCLDHLRDDDIVGRLGGEEFGILLPGCDAETALAAADRFREAIEHIAVDPEGDGPCLTASIGVTVIQDDEADLERAIARADRALYEAKRLGRNRAVLASVPAAARVSALN